MQEGATYEYTLAYVDDVAKTVNNLIPERDGVISMVRGGGGNVRVTLVNPKERERTQQEIADELEYGSAEKDQGKIDGDAAIDIRRKTCRNADSICSAGYQH